MPKNITGINLAPELKHTHYPSHYPMEFMTSPDTLWLKVTPRTFRPDINVQSNTNTGTFLGSSLYFLLSKTFSFGVDHTWDDLTTVSGAIRDVKAGVQNALTQAGAITRIDTINYAKQGKTVKNDNAYVYETSSRRKLSLEFNFAARSDPEAEVWNPIQSLIIWSCADKVGGQFSTMVNFPYVFRLQTVTGAGVEVGLIDIQNACIDLVTPTYSEPYINGYPMSADVTIEFTDINPTYRSLISPNGKARIRTGLEGPSQEELDRARQGRGGL